MQILSHRGLWSAPTDQNRAPAFEKSFQSGFGLETDVRDQLGELVISHDPALAGASSVGELLALALQFPACPVALNIKADGLAPLIATTFAPLPHGRWFCFDMSVPEMRRYAQLGIPFLTRQSDCEPIPIMLHEASGVWLDAFDRDWITTSVIREHLEADRFVCIVSPELHKRNHESVWKRLRQMPEARSPRLMLCTDHPQHAYQYFNES